MNGNRNISLCFNFSTSGGIRRGLLLMLLLILSVASALAQKPVVDMGSVPQCETTQFSVVDWPGDRYTWDLYRDSTVNFAQENGDVDRVPYFVDGKYEGSTININWLDTGKYFVRVMVWDEETCTNNLMLFKIKVNANPPMAELFSDSTCIGEPTIVRIVLTGHGPWDLTYTYVSHANGETEINVNLPGQVEDDFTVSLPPLPVGITEIWVKQIIDQCTENLIPSDRGRIVIFPKPSQSKIYQVEK